MRKLSYLLLVLALALPLALPLAPALAQDTVVLDRLVEYENNLPAGFGSISAADLNLALIDNPDLTLVDVREVDEYAGGHIAGAFNVPIRELAQHLDMLPDLDAPIVVICGSGFRSAIGMASLQILGYSDVRSLSGGMGGWAAEAYATVTDEEAVEAGEAPAFDEAVLSAVDAQLAALPQGFGGVGATDLNIDLIENPPAILIDVRTDAEWAEGYIAGATHLSLDQLMSNAGDLPEDMDANIVVYCKGGHRGNIGATMLRTYGYTNVRNLSGGIVGWQTAGLPVEGAAEAPAQTADADPVFDALVAYQNNLPPAFGSVSVDDLAIELIDNADLTLVDVREVDEYAGGHIDGAFNVPIRELAQNLNLLPELDAPIVVICGSGFRSALGMASLQILGYTDVRSMSGGMGAWNAEEYAVTTDEVAVEAGEAPAFNEAVLSAVDAQLAGLPQGFGGIGATDFSVELIENPPAILIDVRTDAEWAEGYIADAVHMPLDQLMNFAADLPAEKDANIVVYCKGGHRGNIGATMLRTMGYTNVRNLSGGISGWLSAGLPVEGAAEAAASGELNVADLFTSYIAELPASFNAIRVDDAAAAVESNPDLVIVDVRSVDEFVEGHIAGAINIPLNELADHLDLLPNQDADMLVYCGSGHRSTIGMVMLNLMGYTNAQSMFSGMNAWTAAGYEVTTDVVEPVAGEAPAVDAALLEMARDYVQNLPAGFYTIKAEDLNIALIENPPVLIDVRTPSEWGNGIIEGALPIELRTFMENQAEWPADTSAPVVVYAISHRSVIAMIAMQWMGYEDVHALAGGINAWTAAGYPVVTATVTE